MKVFLTLISILLLPTLTTAQLENTYLSGLYTSLSEAPNDTARMDAYVNLASYYRLEDRDSTNLYLEKALPIAVSLNLKLDEASILKSMGIILMQEEKFSKSLESYLKALNIAKDPAIEKNIRNLKPGQTPRNARLFVVSDCYDLIGLLNAYTGNWTDNIENQMKNYREAEKYAKEAGDRKQIAYINFHMGIAYMNGGKLDSALILIKNAIATFSDLKDISGSGRAIKYLGDTYQRMGDYDLAAKTILQSIPLLKKTNDYVHLGLAYISLNRVYTDLKKNDSALYYARESLAIYQKRRDAAGKKNAYNLLASHYDQMGRTDSATMYLKLAKSLGDSLSEEMRKNLLAFQDVVVAEQVKLEKLEKEKIETRDKLRIYLLMSGIVISIGVALLLYRNNKHRKQTNLTLQQQNKEIENALHRLRSVQTQLIQSEKMASLGELTAGIAHEIQNPLNFVNNFSEVNAELLTELEREAEKGNVAEMKLIVQDLKANEDKIMHHGKRADSIVKGMLQHSQKGSGIKQLTDINAMADEYFRLAYHGLRAKDNSLKVNIETRLDENIGNIMLVQQDISRVLLNLYNNAFYAVAERFKKEGPQFNPLVTLTTKNGGDHVSISVTDNGVGIPENIRQKIFQPFFTTKPPGEGTGLGLSLSYDIVQASHGELLVESKEGEGTTFTIQLPV